MTTEALPRNPLRIALAGAGAVGTAVARALQSRGHSITAVWSRTESSAASASRRLDAPSVASCEDVARDADVVLVGVVDDAIGGVARDLASGIHEGAVAVHFAGSLGPAALAPVVAAGGRAAALHPVQSLPDFDTALARLPGSAWGVTCSEGLDDWAGSLIRTDLDGHPVRIAAEDRALWHAAAVMTSNGIAALMGSGMALLDAIGVADPTAVLGPLAAGTVENVRASKQPGAAFTGPVVRDDRATIVRHLESLSARAPELIEAYRLAARMVISGARRTDHIDRAAERAMSALLEGA